MRSLYFFSAILLCFLPIASSVNINAQTQDEKWERVKILSEGTRIYVESVGRKPLKGKFVGTSPQSMTIRSNGKDIAVPRSEVTAVYFGKRPSKVKRGLIGALAGAGAGFLIGGIAAVAGADPLAAAGGFLYGIPAGAVIGVATGGGTKKGDLIYAR